MNSTLKMGIAVMGALTIQIHVIHAQNKINYQVETDDPALDKVCNLFMNTPTYAA